MVSSDSPSRSNGLGCVVIGRNEGERLEQCLKSLREEVETVVYVDSGSTDGSAARAAELGALVVDLDLTTPFTAARARNAGYRELKRLRPSLDFVQFVDGDCTIVKGWIPRALEYLAITPRAAVACGRRREKYPDATVYNGLCDIEWDTPVGPARSCGGDAMIRCAAFDEVNGFNPDLIAGEEPELCVRLRQRDWTIQRLDHEMTRHDADVRRFSQWWKRTVRAGHAYAEGAVLHGKPPERHCVREVQRIVFWGAALPVTIVATYPLLRGASLLFGLGYLASAWRCYLATRRRGYDHSKAAAYATSCTIGKFAELEGVVRYHLLRRIHRRSNLIEYKA